MTESYPANLEQRLSRLEAIEDIRRLKATYFHACDHKQVDQIRECYADGPIEIEFGRIGSFTHREQLIAVFSELACHEHIIEMHHAQNPRIDIISDTHATGTWGLYYFLIDTRQLLTTQLGGVYEDEYRRIDGRWQMVRSVFSVTSTLVSDYSAVHLQTIFAGSAAPAELDDPARQAGNITPD